MPKVNLIQPPRFTEMETKAERDEVTCQRPHSLASAKSRLDPRLHAEGLIIEVRGCTG